MICSAKHSAPAAPVSDLFRGRSASPKPALFSLPSISPSRNPSPHPSLSSHKPLHISSLEGGLGFRSRGASFRREAYEADRSESIHLSPSVVDAEEAKSAAAKKLKIGIYFATWWALNVVFNIYNKKVLNAFPFPWLTSTLSLATGSLMMLVSWAIRIAEPPKTDFDFWKALAPVAVAHTIGHVAATVSMSKVAVSFTHIIKSGEPAFSVLVSRFLLGETFPIAVYLSLLPIIGGCGLAAVTELNFNMTGFMGAMISNLAFVFRNIFSKKGMKGKSVSGMNYYACLSILSLLILTPFAVAVEGPQLWAVGWQKALTDIGPNFVWWLAAQSVFYHLYNQFSYMSLDEISPLTFSIGNTMKRISVIVSSIIIFHTPVQPINALGAAIAVFGTFLYSQIGGTPAGIEMEQQLWAESGGGLEQKQAADRPSRQKGRAESRIGGRWAVRGFRRPARAAASGGTAQKAAGPDGELDPQQISRGRSPAAGGCRDPAKAASAGGRAWCGPVGSWERGRM